MIPDYYELFGVDKSASTQEIRAAYKRLLRQTHPDTGGTSGLFILIEQAWDTLQDPTKRASYDRQKARPGQPSSTNGSRQSNAQGDDFNRGYAEEAGRSRFREDKARHEREEAEQRRQEYNDAQARERARQRRRDASENVEAQRLRPYFDAVAQLSQKEKKLHFTSHVRLTYVQALHGAESVQYLVVFVVAALIALIAAFNIMASTSLSGFGYWIAFVINVVVIFLGSGFILVLFASGILWVLKVAAPRRKNVSATELQDEYLSAKSR